jgi:hypothetical protein
LENPQQTDYDRLSSIGSALAALAAKMESQAAAEIAGGLAVALENLQRTDLDPFSTRTSSLGSALAALGEKMEPQAAAEIARRGAQRLATALENPQQTDYVRLSSIGSALAALAAKMEPQAAAEIAGGLAVALENHQRTDSDLFSTRTSSLGNALAALAAKMKPQPAAEIAKGIATALEAPEDPQQTSSDHHLIGSIVILAMPVRLSSLGSVLAALAARMEPQAAAGIARRGAQRLATALENPQQRIPSVFRALAVLWLHWRPEWNRRLRRRSQKALRRHWRIRNRRIFRTLATLWLH